MLALTHQEHYTLVLVCSFPEGAYHVVLPHANSTLAALRIAQLEAFGYLVQHGGRGSSLYSRCRTDSDVSSLPSCWQDRQTRAMFVEFVAYNPMMALFCYVRANIEFTRSGGVLPSHTRSIVRLYSWFESDDPVMVVLEIIVVAFCACRCLSTLTEPSFGSPWLTVHLPPLLHLLTDAYYAAWEFIACVCPRSCGKAYRNRLHTWMHHLNLLCFALMWAFRGLAIMYAPAVESITVEVLYSMLRTYLQLYALTWFAHTRVPRVIDTTTCRTRLRSRIWQWPWLASMSSFAGSSSSPSSPTSRALHLSRAPWPSLPREWVAFSWSWSPSFVRRCAL